MPAATTTATSGASPRSIVIVGGGIIGTSIAYHLSHHPLPSHLRPRITLLETAHHPAPGASGKSGGFLASDWHGPATASLAALSYNLHRDLAHSDNGKERWGYREVETWQVDIDTSLKERGKKAKGAKQIGWLDQSVVKGTSRMGGGGTTAQVDPAKLTSYLLDKARDAGVHTLLGTTATGLHLNDAGHVTAIDTASDDGAATLETTDLILAAGPWTGSLITRLFPRHRLPPHLKSAAAIDGSRAHSVVLSTPPAQPLSSDCLFTEMAYGPGARQAGAPELYARPDGTAYLCGGSDDVPLPATADAVSFDPKKTEALIEQAKVLAPLSLDVASGATVLRQQACYLPISNRTGNPVLGGKEGVYVAAGHSCWGITNSLGTGKVMAELVLDGKVQSADITALMPK